MFTCCYGVYLVKSFFCYAPFVFLCLVGGCAPRLERPHIVLLTLDTTRQDRLGCYGHEAAVTPALDALAGRGVRFDSAVSVVPLTLPAHTTILSGLLPPEHGLRVNGQGAVSTNLPLIQVALQAHGYQTGAAIAAAVLDRPYGLARGFSWYDASLPETKWVDPDMPGGMYHATTPASRRAADVVDVSLNWLRGCSADQPVFLWAHFYDPHDPYDDCSRELGHYFDSAYDSEIAYMDREIGRLLEGVRELLGRRVVVIAVGDHGESLGEHGEVGHGMTLYQGAMRVPLMLSGPGVPKGQVDVRVVSLTDITPTILQLCGISEEAYLGAFPAGPTRLSGHSLLRSRPDQRHCYMETLMPLIDYHWAPLHAVSDGEWKYIRSPLEELYDLHHDRAEGANQAVVYDDVASRMREVLVQFETGSYMGKAESIEIGAEGRRQLESLGYAAGASPVVVHTETATNIWADMADIKEMIALVPLSARVREFLAHQEVTEETLSWCRELVAKSPQTPRFHSYLAGCLLRLAHTSEALEVLSAAVAQFPEDVHLHSVYGRVLLGQEQYADAGPILRRALSLSPESAPVLAALGVVLLHDGAPGEAQKHLEASVSLDATSHGAAKYLGDAYAVMCEHDKAIASYRRALELNPHWPAALAPLVESYLERGGEGDAAVALPLAWDLCEQSKHADVHDLLLLAKAYVAAERPDKARETAASALALARETGVREQVSLFLESLPTH